MATMKKVVKKAKPALKLGRRVQFTRRNGETATGSIVGTDDTSKGRWVAVNTAKKGKNPEVTKVRQSMLMFL
jgi:hypothetical protein